MHCRLTVLLVVLAATAAQEAEEEPLLREHLTKLHPMMDKNGDGQVHFDELLRFAHDSRLKAAKNEFKLLDQNRDGQASLREVVEAFVPEGAVPEKELKDYEKRKFRAVDLDGDKLLTWKEAQNLWLPEQSEKLQEVIADHTWKDWDMDRDGFISKQEFSPGESEDPELAFANDESRKRDVMLWKILDKNGDNRLDKKEFAAFGSNVAQIEVQMRMVHEQGDTTGDGHISLAELEAMHEWILGANAIYHFQTWVQHHEL